MNRSYVGIVKVAALSILVSGFLYSCKGAKKTAATPDVVNKPQQGIKPEDYLQQKIDYTTFSGKASMHYEGKNQSQDFSANLKMRKDKDIWASIVALGGLLEAARAYVTPDSLKALDKLQRKAYVLSYSEGIKMIDAEVEFPVLQNLIIGNVLFDNGPIKNVVEKDSLISFSMTKGDFNQTLTYNKKTGLLQKTDLKSEKRNFTCTITYDKYAAITGKQPFAYNRAIDINNKGEQIKLTMEFGKAELNVPVEMPFVISDSYKIQEIKKK